MINEELPASSIERNKQEVISQSGTHHYRGKRRSLDIYFDLHEVEQ